MPVAQPRDPATVWERAHHIHVSDTEVRCDFPGGRTQRLSWEDLQAVFVRTTSEGPWLPDVFWVLVGTSADSACVIPQGATGEAMLLDRLCQLPGFVIRGMNSTDDREFLCWRRPEVESIHHLQ